MDDFNTYLPPQAVGSRDSHFNKSSGPIRTPANSNGDKALTPGCRLDYRGSAHDYRERQLESYGGSSDSLQLSWDDFRQSRSKVCLEANIASPATYIGTWHAGQSADSTWQDVHSNPVESLTPDIRPRQNVLSRSIRDIRQRISRKTYRRVVGVGQTNNRRNKGLKCTVDGCTTEFTSAWERKRHVADKHPAIGEGRTFKCGVLDCSSPNRFWRRRDKCREHVRKNHRTIVDVESYIQECTINSYNSEKLKSQAEDVVTQGSTEFAANEKFNKRHYSPITSSPLQSNEPVLKKMRRAATRLPRETAVIHSPAPRQPHFAEMVMTNNDSTQVASVAEARPECARKEARAKYDAFQVPEPVDAGDVNLEHQQGSEINTGQLSGSNPNFNSASTWNGKGKGKERERSPSTDPSEAGSQPVVPPPKKDQRSFRCVYRHDPSKVKSQAECNKPHTYPSGLKRHHRTHGLHYCHKCWKKFDSHQLFEDHLPCNAHRCLKRSCGCYEILLAGPCPMHGRLNEPEDKYHRIYRLAHVLSTEPSTETLVETRPDGSSGSSRPSLPRPPDNSADRVRVLEDVIMEFLHDNGSNYLYFRERMETVLGQEAMERWRLASSYDTAPSQPGQVGPSESRSLLHASTNTLEQQHQQLPPAPPTHVAPSEYIDAEPSVRNDTFHAQPYTDLPSGELSWDFGAHFEGAALLSNQDGSWHAAGFNTDRVYLNGVSFNNVDWPSYQSFTDQASAFGNVLQSPSPVASEAPLENMERNPGTSNALDWSWGVRDQIDANNSFPPGFHVRQTTDDVTTARTPEYESWSNGFGEDELF